jgi:hypothetical protein
MSSIRWIRNVTVNGTPCALEVMIGVQHIADRCYVRIGQEPEIWFVPQSEEREMVISQAVQILWQRLQNADVRNLDGTPFTWE